MHQIHHQAREIANASTTAATTSNASATMKTHSARNSSEGRLALARIDMKHKTALAKNISASNASSLTDATTRSTRAAHAPLTRWGFTPQKPIKRAYEQSPEAVQAWLEGEYPGVEARARREGAEIHWGDATALVNTDVRARS